VTLPSFLREVTQAWPDNEALVLHHADGSVARWTYRELWQRSNRIAQALVASGVDKGTPVGILMTNRPEWIAACFIKTGGANVSPVEVGWELGSYPGVKLCKTTGVPHTLLGEMVVSLIVPGGGESPREAEVIAWLKTRLAQLQGSAQDPVRERGRPRSYRHREDQAGRCSRRGDKVAEADIRLPP